MEWIKAHLTIVICGALSLLSVVLIGLGFFLTDVTDVMAKDASLNRTLVSIEPTNEQVVDYWEQLLKENSDKAEESMAELAQLGAHEPLTQGLFPVVQDNYAPFQFQKDYEVAHRDLVDRLNAGNQPSAGEIAHARALMEETAKHREEVERLGAGESPRETRQPVRSPRGFGVFSQPPTAQPSPTAPEPKPEESPEVLVSLRRARDIYCYLDPDRAFGSYARVRRDQERPLPPTPEQAWYAQVALWIQRDIVGALAALNNQAAERLEAAGEQPWVGNLPVKHVRTIDVGCYVSGSDTSGEKVDTFTERSSDGTIDVVRIEVDLVIDARKLPAVLDRICAAGFYTPLLVSYSQVPVNTSLTGYIYGSDPVIRVMIPLEGCFLRSKHEQWMPETVKRAIEEGQACPRRVDRAEGQETSSGTGRSGNSSWGMKE